VSYDLYAWPVDRPMSADEARVEIEGRLGKWPLGLGRDKRLSPFVKAMEHRFPGLGTPVASVPMEFDVHRSWVFMALPWSYVAGLVEAIAPIAFEAGLALYDPQRDEVALPAPFGAAPLGTAGITEHERLAEEAFDLIRQGAAVGPDGEPMAASNDLARDAGFKIMSPLGFEITPDIEDEVKANPLRVPAALQSADHKAELIAQLDTERSGEQQQALVMLGGWDPDPDVRAALRARLDANDVYVVGFACAALARQGNPTDLPGLLDAVYRMSPADGGSLDSMLMPLTAALDVAERVGPEAVEEVRSKARAWRRPPEGHAQRPRGLLDEELDRLLGDRRG
jgi:hypothetical protein